LLGDDDDLHILLCLFTAFWRACLPPSGTMGAQWEAGLPRGGGGVVAVGGGLGDQPPGRVCSGMERGSGERSTRVTKVRKSLPR
jgi:hypothetical protein